MAEQFTLFDENLQPVRREPAAGDPSPALSSPSGADPIPDAAAAATPELRVVAAEEKAERLAALRQEAVVCLRCGLSRTRTNVVFGEGNPDAPLVFVGEGPGETEDATGRPFVGRAGRLLDEVLRRNGMTRSHVYICNIVKCRAADMAAGRWLNRPPAVEEVAACRPWLEEQFRILKPLVIVCVGGPAANTIIRPGFRISSERGRWCTSCGYAPWVLAVLHPAYVLRQEGAAYDAALQTLIDDVGRARQKVIEVRRERRVASAG